KQRRTYTAPLKRWDKEKIELERGLVKNYGLRRKKELWRLEALLRRFRSRAKKLIATRDATEEKILLQKLHKLGIIKDIMRIIEKNIESYGNLIVTGSFLDEGFHFNDLDLIFVAENEIKTSRVKEEIKEKTGIQAHILTLNNKSLVRGLEVDPLYQMMLSRCIVSNRFVFKAKHRVDYKLLDLHLLKSKTLIDNYNFLSGNEKYDLVRNMLAIWLYMNDKKINKEIVDREIKTSLGLNDVNELKQNMVDKKIFLKKYKLMYDKTFAKILRGIESGANVT
ncbi:hypothetical protein HYT51_01905, partial [Candidatus Woesearchaeota archaeon]|nr:hypothetical protein [Candidatus Woesearchaeota archaeon]